MKDVLLFWVDLPVLLLPILICAGLLLFCAGWWKAKLRYVPNGTGEEKREQIAQLGWWSTAILLESFLWDAVSANPNPEGQLLQVRSIGMTVDGLELRVEKRKVPILRILLDPSTGYVREFSLETPDGVVNSALSLELLRRWWSYLSLHPAKTVPMTMSAYIKGEAQAHQLPGTTPVIAE